MHTINSFLKLGKACTGQYLLKYVNAVYKLKFYLINYLETNSKCVSYFFNLQNFPSGSFVTPTGGVAKGSCFEGCVSIYMPGYEDTTTSTYALYTYFGKN